MSKAAASVAASAIAALVLLQGCGGGGIDFANLEGHLIAVSFVGYLPAPGVAPNAFVPLPTVFRDQALEFTFDKPLDPGSLGGFLTNAGSPVEMVGTGAVGLAGVPYLPFADQEAARHSLQVRRNELGGPEHSPYVVGRHRDRPDTVVVDPRLDPGNPFGLPASPGFLPNQLYVVMIPADNGFRFGAFRAEPFGAAVADLPITIPPFSTQPALSRLFRAGISFGPDPVPPEVLSITRLTADAATPFVITFSKYVTLDSIDPLRNLVVRNLDVTTPSSPLGIIVPGSITALIPGSPADFNLLFTPAAPYGPGVSPTQGFEIEVRVGTFGQPGAPPILGVPLGVSGTQLPLSNSLAQVFETTPCQGCQTPASVVESFDDTLKRDPTFVQTFGPQQARWNHASAPGKLAGRFLSGSPSGSLPDALGTRIQIITGFPYSGPQPVYGLFSPFDASLANSGGECPSPPGCNLGLINPQGGSHIMHLYEAADLGNVEDSLEQIEWRPFDGATRATVYPQYTIWCGLTSTAAPIGGGGGTGLTSVYDANYDLTPYQVGSVISPLCGAPAVSSPRKVVCGFFGQPYLVPLRVTQFHPFPLLNPCFDFATSTGLSGNGVNLLIEQNIEPGMQMPNFNTSLSNGSTPVRRLVGRPLSQVSPGVCPFNEAGGSEKYFMRFTLVGLSGQARSLWYDTGAADPTYLGFIETPNHSAQPFGTQTTIVLEGTDVANPGPATSGVGGTYVSANGVVNPAVLTTLSGLRYFRFRVELRGNNVMNTTPAYASFVMAYTQ